MNPSRRQRGLGIRVSWRRPSYRRRSASGGCGGDGVADRTAKGRLPRPWSSVLTTCPRQHVRRGPPKHLAVSRCTASVCRRPRRCAVSTSTPVTGRTLTTSPSRCASSISPIAALPRCLFSACRRGGGSRLTDRATATCGRTPNHPLHQTVGAGRLFEGKCSRGHGRC